MTLSSDLTDIAIFFDIDDTLISETDYIDSALTEFADKGFADLAELNRLASINREKGNYSIYEIIKALPEQYISEAKDIYRKGNFTIKPIEGAEELIKELKERGSTIGIISDGWSLRQRNKLNNSGIGQYIDYCIISEECGNEKLTGIPFKLAMEKCRNKRMIYVGDNPAKDFVRAKEYGWTTIMVRNPSVTYIHDEIIPDAAYSPDITLKSLTEIPGFLASFC